MVNVTDKCYENLEGRATETTVLGGSIPTAPRAAPSWSPTAYRRSFFARPRTDRGSATARAGNVIGGGDWGEDRLIPDIIRRAREGETIPIRNPVALRPWQHVLDPLSGYLVLAQALVAVARATRAAGTSARRPRTRAPSAGSWSGSTSAGTAT